MRPAITLQIAATIAVFVATLFMASPGPALAASEPEPEAPAQNLAQLYPLPLIATGTEVAAEEFSFMVSVQLGGGHYCSGALIKPDWVLTSARCVAHHQAGAQVRLGSEQIMSEHSLISIQKILRHPLYQYHSHQHDIALLQLAGAAPAQFRPLQLPNARVMAQLVYPGVYLKSASWGALNARGEAAEQLLQQSLPLQAHINCNGPTAYQGAVLPSMLCLGFARGDNNNCVADSGAPLLGFYQGNYYHLGVASFGQSCTQTDDVAVLNNHSADAWHATRSGNYTIFSSSWFYLDWLEAALSGNN
ncbi:S1 family peptidase [Rheinheimera sp. 4Y26]|uniref:S1 family peptidase n=1 Tax=Rheinheimera sp. 4Y26 TaxID=2977811 RepID=UPI0021B116DF|nr:trypsin-like serine protease [Rheinheimera sp. 4Y26]MCT6698399.1 trypsin-like serine protease [Rheinheimera sp. 4Y26]